MHFAPLGLKTEDGSGRSNRAKGFRMEVFQTDERVPGRTGQQKSQVAGPGFVVFWELVKARGRLLILHSTTSFHQQRREPPIERQQL